LAHEFFSRSDVEEAVHPERVALAWQRTLLSLVVIVAAIMRYGLSMSGIPALAWALGAATLLLIAIALVLNRHRYRVLRNRMLEREFPPPPAAIMFIISLSLVMAGVLVITVAARSVV
jgi:uncharacterized membrane protein YidH (DUF202 family)